MNYILPRVIKGNRGDIASRWGVLRSLHQMGVQGVTAFTQFPDDVPDLPYHYPPYGRGRNLLLSREGRQAFRRPGAILWAVGLDLQDDSSLARLLYHVVQFSAYRRQGRPVCCLFQGAGPLATKTGRLLARAALQKVNLFVARDPGTLRLIEKVSPDTPLRLGHDAIFLPGFEVDLEFAPPTPEALAAHWETARPLIGLNLRQWFHFASSLLPYQFNRSRYQARSEAKMAQLIASLQAVVSGLRSRFDARVLLLSAYQPDVLAWEDDLPWLARLKASFADDPEVQLVSGRLAMPDYYRLMSNLDLMIAMRLHSSLIALRFGVPAINLSYTLKGGDIYNHLGLTDSALSLTDIVQSPQPVLNLAERFFSEMPIRRLQTAAAVQTAIATNRQVLEQVHQELSA